MEREKPTFDILGRIEKERAARNWSEYALAENSGLTQCKSFQRTHISFKDIWKFEHS